MTQDSSWHLEDTEFPAIRRVLGPEHVNLSDDVLERRIERAFPAVEAMQVEDFMQSLQSFGNTIAPIAQRVLPAAAQGAVQGGMVAGPWGALAGAVAGGVGGALSSNQPSRPAAPAPMPPPMTPPPAPAPTPISSPIAGFAAPGAGAMPAPSTAATASSPATAQLLALLSQPETMRALLALLMPQSGRQSIPVGNQQIPPAAFANAIAELAYEVAESVTTNGNGSDYLFNKDGSPRGDIANPRVRAAILLTDLTSASGDENEMEADEESDIAEEWWSPDEFESEMEEETDALDAYEQALEAWETESESYA